MMKKGALVALTVISLFLTLIFIIITLSGRKAALFFTIVFGAVSVYGLSKLNRYDKASGSVPARQSRPQLSPQPRPQQPNAAPAPVTVTNYAPSVGGIGYITSRGITPEMVYDLSTKYSNKDGFGSVYFPKNFGSLSFAKKFDAVKVCIITTERPNFRNIKLGENVILVPEPTNAYDPNAIMILSRTQKLGYIYRNGIQDILNEKFREGCVVVGSVVSKEAKSDYIKIDIVVYK